MKRNTRTILSYTCSAVAIVAYTISFRFWWLFIILISVSGFLRPHTEAKLTTLQTTFMFGNLVIAAALLFIFDTSWARVLFCLFAVALCGWAIYHDLSHSHAFPDSNRNA